MTETSTNNSLKNLLQKYFGHHSFRPFQEEIIKSVIDGNDTLAIMPTGGGKSICFQLPALAFNGLTIVISPLIALMKDQVDALKINGIPAEFLNSTQSTSEQNYIIQRLKNDEIKLLYLAPERIFSEGNTFIDFLKTLPIQLFAIDEAHCISQWGHDFRPEYTKLSVLKREFPKVPLIALTATADDKTRLDIIKILGVEKGNKFIAGFNRPNIHYFVQAKRNSKARLVEFLKNKKKESGIIYTLSRKSTESLAEDLNDLGFSALPYHAGLSNAEREKNQDLFIKDEVKIIVATIAFGMGIDKSNVRFVVHMDLPKNIEGYYQETGRAGRDGLKSDALLFFSRGDAILLTKYATIEHNPEQSAILLRKLDKMVEYCETTKCRRTFLLNYFGENHEESNCKSCDICLSDNKKFDGTIIAQKILSAVARTEESFGINYLIDFLRGSKSEKIRFQHKTLKTYGIGADLGKEEWQYYFKQLIDLDLLKIAEGVYPIIKLTDESKNILFGKKSLELFQYKIEEPAEEITDESVPNSELALFEILRTLRLKLAKDEGVPPYIIFPDNTLMQLATYLPLNLEDLKNIDGFGNVKINKYGEIFLQPMIEFAKSNNLTTRSEQNKISKVYKRINKVTKKSSKSSDTKLESLEMFKKGLSAEEIAFHRNLALSTVESHLVSFIPSGEISINQFVSQDKISLIKNALEKNIKNGLREVKNSLDENITYAQIKAVQELFGIK
jgi:ATP-dependent DNA helicase RecQ